MSFKTNAMRILEKNKIDYIAYEYDVNDNLIDGEHVAEKCNKEYKEVFKTLVGIGSDKNYYVFCIPVNKNLDFKQCAKVLNLKNIELIEVKKLLNITGYIRGGCSPIGMKKQFITVFDESVNDVDKICVSGGKIGIQIEVLSASLLKITNAKVAKITV